MATLNDCAIGDIVKLYVGGVQTEFIVVQKNTPPEDVVDYHSYMNNIWLMMKDISCLMAWGTAEDDYSDSAIHAYLNGAFVNSIGKDVASQIVEARVPYTKGIGEDSEFKDGSSGLRAKAFLLSECEISGDVPSGYNTDGGRIDYFPGTSEARIAYFNGNAAGWWTRTQGTSESERIRIIKDNGTITSGNVADIRGVRPVIILPKSTVIIDGVIGEEPTLFSGSTFVDGVSKELSGAHANIGGVWKEVTGAYMNIDGTWKPM